jgi:CheY-like chemotaxis protein
MPASILIIEDYSAHLELVRYLLEHEGHETVTAMTGEHAMEVLAGVTPDLMLCDLHLGGGMDGYTFTEWGPHPAPVGGVFDALYDGLFRGL